jgi:hypothetical protein
VGGLSMPMSMLGNQSAADISQGIDVVLTSFAGNVHGDPAAQNATTGGNPNPNPIEGDIRLPPATKPPKGVSSRWDRVT